MLKRLLLFAAVAVKCSLGVYAVQVGDVDDEFTEEIFSETDRITVNDVEFLYTFKGVQNYKSVVGGVDSNGNASYTYGKYEDIETQFVIEKAIPLTGNYNIVIKVRDLLNAVGMCITAYYNNSNGTDYISSNFYCTASSSIVIGDSCFEDNELVKTVCIEADEVGRGLRIAKRSFYGAKNFRYLTVMNVIGKYSSSSDDEPPEHFVNLPLISIGESAFEGCTSLGVVGCDCSELTRIEKNAFKDCSKFLGLVSSYESLEKVGSWDDGDCYMNGIEIIHDRGHLITNKLHYVWNTPKLEYIGEYAFSNAGSGYVKDYYDEEIGISREEYIEWSFGKGDVEIGESAFYNCSFLKEIHFPSTMARIKDRMFYGIHRSKRSPTQLYFSDSLIEIGQEAFMDASMQVMRWPESLKEIDNYAFSASRDVVYNVNEDRTAVVTSLVYNSTLALPANIEKMGEGVFSGSFTIGYAWSKPQWKDGKIESLAYSSADVIACGSVSGTINWPRNLTSIPKSCFYGNMMLEELVLHNFVTNIGSYAFKGCSRLNLIVPASVCEVGVDSGASYSLSVSSTLVFTVPGVKSVIFEGRPPKGIKESGFLNCSQVLVSAEYASDWAPYMRDNVKLAKKVDGEWITLGGKVISNAMRASDPTIMDIKYKATSTKDKVNVRILAYKDGVRSFANVLPVATFVDGTEANVGDGVAANVEHTVSWQVSKDWEAELAKVSVEVFVMEDNLLPLQLTTIPANNGHPSVTFSRNKQSDEKVMNALYWLYADKTSDLTLENGVLKSGGKQLVNGTTLSTENALSYIYSKMGYGLLSGDTLKYVNNLMRSSISSGKFAVKEGAAE